MSIFVQIRVFLTSPQNEHLSSIHERVLKKKRIGYLKISMISEVGKQKKVS